jgi:hypothetical protein
MEKGYKKSFQSNLGMTVDACLPTGRQVPYDDFKAVKGDKWLGVKGL